MARNQRTRTRRAPRESPRPGASIVVPVFNEAESLPELVRRLREACPEDTEFIFVNDGSTDGSLGVLLEERKKDRRLKIIDFNRNYGQHAAVLAGLGRAQGECVVTLDADLQNPPEEIPKVIESIRSGHDIVSTYRENRKDSILRRVLSRVTNAIVARWTGVRLRDLGCMLRGYRRDVLHEIRHSSEITTFVPALAAQFARSPAEIPVKHDARHHGRSRYSLLKLLRLQLDLLTGFTMAPLRFLFIFGLLVSLVGIGFGVYLLVRRFVLLGESEAEGVFTLFAILFVFVGAQFLAFGLLGEYLGRIYGQVRRRPRFVVRRFYR